MEAPVHVLLIDAHELFRRGVRAALESRGDIDVVAEASTGEEGLAAAAAAAGTRVDVVLLELSLPGMSGLEVVGRLSAASPRPRILVLTAGHDEAQLFAALRAGADGYLVKEATGAEVSDAVRAARRGESPISPAMASRLLEGLGSGSSPVRADHSRPGLSSRQLEVLRLVARGLTNREVARALFISENTVKNHLRNILEKLQVRTRVQAAMLAVRERLIEPDGQVARPDGAARAPRAHR